MFLGTHTPKLDDKGRLFLPAKFRDELAEGLVVTKGQERCLSVFPLDEFERISGKLRAGARAAQAEVDDPSLINIICPATARPHPQPAATVRENQ